MASNRPTISIVVPNFNGGATIGATLQSILEQDYPGLEIVVIDGASTDNSVEIIKSFEKQLSYWVSEKDRGQSEAINKGFAKCTGEIVNWICSDDLLLPGALQRVGREFAEHPSTDVVVGACQVRYEVNRSRDDVQAPTLEKIEMIPFDNPIPQSSCFFKRSLLDRPKPVDESYQFLMDFELWAYFKSKGVRWRIIPDVLSVFVISGHNKTSAGSEPNLRAMERVYCAYTSDCVPLTFWHRHLRFPIERLRVRHRGRCARLLLWPLNAAVVLALSPFYGLRQVRAMSWTWWV